MELSSTIATTPSPLTRLRARAHAKESPRTTQFVLTSLLIACDAVALLAIFALAYLFRFQNPWLPYAKDYSVTFYSTVVFLAIPLWIILFALYGLYNSDMLFGGVHEYAHVWHACTIGVMVLILFSFLFREDAELSRVWLVCVWLLAIGLITTERFLFRRGVYALRQAGHFSRRVIIVGANPEGEAVAEQLVSAPTAGLEVVGLVGRRKSDQGIPMAEVGLDSMGFGNRRLTDRLPDQRSNAGFPMLGCVEQLPELVSRYNVDEIIIAPTAISRAQLLDTYQTFGLWKGVEMRLSPGLFEMLTTGARVKEAGSVPLVSLNRLRITGIDAGLKWLLDYSLVSLASPILILTFIMFGVLIRLDSPGPIIHRRRVLGLGGQMFDAFKFRTMVTNADEVLAKLLASDPAIREEFEQNHKLRNDPRVTRLGRFLRRTSLDELPQLINVVFGQMSLVGPRMIAEEEIEKYGKWWMNLLTVKPGITGPWQTMGRNELPYEERIRLSMKYIRNYTIWSDFHILFQTIGVVLHGKGAF